jgi:hypothetical protein
MVKVLPKADSPIFFIDYINLAKIGCLARRGGFPDLGYFNATAGCKFPDLGPYDRDPQRALLREYLKCVDVVVCLGGVHHLNRIPLFIFYNICLLPILLKTPG